MRNRFTMFALVFMTLLTGVHGAYGDKDQGPKSVYLEQKRRVQRAGSWRRAPLSSALSEVRRGLGQMTRSLSVVGTPFDQGIDINNGPTVSISGVQDGVFSASGRPRIEVSCGDGSSPVDMESLEILIDGVNRVSDFTVINRLAVSHSLPELSDGAHTLLVNVADSAGQTAQASLTFSIDTTEPSLSALGSPEIVNHPTPTLTFQVSDGGAGLNEDSLTVEVNGQGVAQGGTVTNGEFSVTMPAELGLVEGLNSVLVSVVDQLGHEAQLSLAITLDTTAPSLVILPDESRPLVSTQPTFQVTVDDGSAGSGVDFEQVVMTLDGVDVTNSFSRLEKTYSWAVETPLSPGTHLLSVVAFDLMGNQVSQQASFTLDSEPPTIVSAFPESGQTLNSRRLTVRVAVEDNGLVMTPKTIFMLDGVDRSDEIRSLGSVFQFETSLGEELEDGAHSYTITVEDSVGLQTTRTTAFKIDKSGPVLTVNPGDQSVLATATPALTVSVTDADSEIDPSSFRLTILNQDMSEFVTNDGALFQIDFTEIGPLPDGLHVLHFSARDVVGNESEKQVSLFIDTQAPVITSSLQDGDVLTSLQPALSFSFSDALPGRGVDMSTLSISLDGLGTGFDLELFEAGVVLTPTTELSEGAHVLSLTVQDFAGNSTTQTTSFKTETLLHHFDLELSPANPQGVPAHSKNDLRVSARTASGGLVKNFVGFLEFATSTGNGPLHGFVALMRTSDEGQILIPELATFDQLGAVTISVQSLNQAQFTGTLSLQVLAEGPVLYAPDGVLIANQNLTLRGLAYPSQTIEIKEDSVVLATTSADSAGQFTALLNLEGGSHELIATCLNPQTQQLETSAPRTLFVHSLPAFLSQEPSRTNSAVLPMLAQALPGSTVDLLWQGQVVDSQVSDSSGKSTVQFHFPSPGEYTLKLRMTIEGVSHYSEDRTLIFNTSPPKAPQILSPQFFALTRLSGIEISGSTEESGMLWFSQNEGVPTQIAQVTEAFTLNLPAELLEGKNEFSFWIVDDAGNSSEKIKKYVYYGEDYVAGRLTPAATARTEELGNWSARLLDESGQLVSEVTADPTGFFFIPNRSGGSHIVLNPPAGLLWSEKFIALPENEEGLVLPPIVVNRIQTVGTNLSLDENNRTIGLSVAKAQDSRISVEIPPATPLQLHGEGILSVRRIPEEELPASLPAQADPRMLIEVTPHGDIGDLGATLTFPNIYQLPANAEIIVYGYHYGRSSLPQLDNGWTVHRAQVSEDEQSFVVENIDTFSVFSPQLQVNAGTPSSIQSGRQFKVLGKVSLAKKPSSPIWVTLSNGSMIKLPGQQGIQAFEFNESLNPQHSVSVTVSALIGNLMVRVPTTPMKVPNQGFLIDLGQIELTTNLGVTSFLPGADSLKASADNSRLSVSIGSGLATVGTDLSVGTIPALYNSHIGSQSPILSPFEGDLVRPGFSLIGERRPGELVEIFVDGTLIASSANNDPQFVFSAMPGSARESFAFTPDASHFAAGGNLGLGERILSYIRASRYSSSTVKVIVDNATVPGGHLVISSVTFPVAPATVNPGFASFELEFNQEIVDQLATPTDLSSNYAFRLGPDQDGDGQIDFLLPIKLDRSLGTRRVVIYPNGGSLSENTDYYLQVGTALEDIHGNTLGTAASFAIRTSAMPSETPGLNAPTISLTSPTGLGIASETPISFQVSDAESGVQIDSLSLEVTVKRSGPSGTTLAEVTRSFSGNSEHIFYSGSPQLADIRLIYPGGLPSGADVAVKAFVYDYAGNESVAEWSFLISEDSTPPTITMDQPLDGENHVSAFTPVVLTLSDLDSGLDRSKTYIEIAGVKYSAVQQYQSNFVGVDDAALSDEGLRTSFPHNNGVPALTHAEQTLPFDFPFEGRQVSKIRIYAHGYLDLVFDDNSIAEFPEAEGTAATLRQFPRIAPFWARLKNVELITKSRVESSGEQSFEVRWEAETDAQSINGGVSTSTGPITFAARFYSDGRIAFRYDGVAKAAGDLTKPIRGLSGGSTGGFRLLPEKDLWEQFESQFFELKTRGLWQESGTEKSFTVTIQPLSPLSGTVNVHYYLVNDDYSQPRVLDSQSQGAFSFQVLTPSSSAPPAPVVTSIQDGDRLAGPTPIELIAIGRPGDVIVATEASGGTWRAVVNSAGVFRALTSQYEQGTKSFTFVAFDSAGQVSAPAGPVVVIIEPGKELSPQAKTISKSESSPNKDKGPTESSEIRVDSYYSTRGSRPDQLTWLDGNTRYWTPGTGSQYAGPGDNPRLPMGVAYTVPYREAGIVPDVSTYTANTSQQLKSISQRVVPGAVVVPYIRNDFQTGAELNKIGRVRFEILSPPNVTFLNGLQSVDCYFEGGEGLGPALRVDSELRVRITHLEAAVFANGKFERDVQSREVVYKVDNVQDSRITRATRPVYIAPMALPQDEFVVLRPPTSLYVGEGSAEGVPQTLTPGTNAPRFRLYDDRGILGQDSPLYQVSVSMASQSSVRNIPSLSVGDPVGLRYRDNVILYSGSVAPVGSSTSVTVTQPYLQDFVEANVAPSYQRSFRLATSVELDSIRRVSLERNSSPENFEQLGVTSKILRVDNAFSHSGDSYLRSLTGVPVTGPFPQNSSLRYLTQMRAEVLDLHRFNENNWGNSNEDSFYKGIPSFRGSMYLRGAADFNALLDPWQLSTTASGPFLIKPITAGDSIVTYDFAKVKVTKYDVVDQNGTTTITPTKSHVGSVLAAPANTVAGPYKLTPCEPKAHIKAQAISFGNERSDGGFAVNFQLELHDQFASFIPGGAADVDTANMSLSRRDGANDYGRVDHTVTFSRVAIENQGLTKWEREVALPYRHLARSDQAFIFYPGETRIDVNFVGRLGQSTRAIYKVEISGQPGARQARWIQLREEQFPAPLQACFLQGLRFQTDVNNPGLDTDSLQLTVSNPGQGSLHRTVPLSRYLSSTAFISSPTIVLTEELAANLAGTDTSTWPIIVMGEQSQISASYFASLHQYTPGDRILVKGIDDLGNEFIVNDLQNFGSFVIEVVIADTENAPTSLDVSVNSASGMKTVTLLRVGNTKTYRSQVIVIDGNDPVGEILQNNTGFGTRLNSPVASEGIESRVQLAGLTRDPASPGGQELEYEALTGVTPFAGFGNSVCVPTGELVFSLPLHSVPSAGLGLNFVATYRSRINYESGPLGHNWDHSYNIRILEEGSDAVLIRNGRRILFKKSSQTSVYHDYDSPPGFYGLLKKLGRKGYRLTDRHGTVTLFQPVGNQSHLAFVKSITDRNNNRLIFNYDSKGDLVQVEDLRAGHTEKSKDRTLKFVYQAVPEFGDGRRRLSRVVDFSGRSVRFNYYSNHSQSSEGKAGDLAAVILPLSDNFPSGTAWSFKYSSLQEKRHNLTEIYDPSGTTVSFQTGTGKYLASALAQKALVVVQYSPEDRVIRQDFGRPQKAMNDEGGHYVFLPSGNQVVVTDPVGTSWTYGFKGATGLDSVLPETTSVQTVVNTSDPSATQGTLTTTCLFNQDGEKVKITRPKGNGTEYKFRRSTLLDPAVVANALNRGNLIEVKQFRSTSQPGPEVVVSMSYFEAESNPAAGLFNQIHTTTDPLGHVVTLTYDSEGNLETRTESVSKTKINGLDFHTVTPPIQSYGSPLATGTNSQMAVQTTYNYYPGGLKKSATAGTGVNASTTRWEYDDDGFVEVIISGESSNANVPSLPGVVYEATTRQEMEYDDVGNLIRSIASNGRVTAFKVNERNEVIESIADAGPDNDTSTGTYFKYRTRYTYDARGLVTRVSRANVLPKEVALQKIPDSAAFDSVLESISKYDARGLLVESRVEKSPGQYAVTCIQYDAAGREILRCTPKAVAANDTTNNVKRKFYDQRGLLLLEKHLQYERRYTYDENGNLGSRTDGSALPEVYSYDGLDRLSAITQEASSVVHLKKKFTRDIKGRVIEELVTGRGGVTVAALQNQAVLGHKYMVYDERDLNVESTVKVYNPINTNVEVIRSRKRFDERSRLTYTEDHGAITAKIEYDSLSRRVATMTPVDVPVAKASWEYDSEGNIKSHTSYERDPLANKFRVETSSRKYDALNRLVEHTRADGSKQRRRYDSLNRVIADQDSRGFLKFRLYDGLNNELYFASSEFSFSFSDDWFFSEFAVERTRVYDANSNILLEKNFDIRGSAADETRFAYDDYNRPVSIEQHKTKDANIGTSLLSRKTMEYDTPGRPAKIIDENGSELTYTYEPNLGFLDTLDVKMGMLAQVKHIDVETGGIKKYSYLTDGMGRILNNTTEETGFGTVSVVNRYDTLGRPVFENTTIVADDQSIDLLKGTATVQYNYSGLHKSSMTYASGYVLGYERDELGRLSRLTHGAENRAEMKWTGSNRPAEISQINGVKTTFFYHPTNGRLTDKVVEKNASTADVVSLHEQYDSEGNVTSESRGRGSRNGASEYTQYAYDSMGRLESVIDSEDPQSLDSFQTRSRFSDKRLKPGEEDATTGAIHSSKGLLVFDGNFVKAYDNFNRLVKVSKIKANLVPNQPTQFELLDVASYHFDGFGRRVAKLVFDADEQSSTSREIERVVRYSYDQQSLLEETTQVEGVITDLNAPENLARYVHGPIGLLEATFFGPSAFQSRVGGSSATLGIHTNGAGRAIVFTDSSGDVFENCDYSGSGNLVKVKDGNDQLVADEARVPLEWVKPGMFQDNELRVGRIGPNQGWIFDFLEGRAELLNGLSLGFVNALFRPLESFAFSARQLARKVDPALEAITGAADGLLEGISAGLYRGQLAADFWGVNTGSTYYEIGKVAGTMVGSAAGAAVFGPAWVGVSMAINVGYMIYGMATGDGMEVLTSAAAIVGDIVGIAFDRIARGMRAASFELPTPAARNSVRTATDTDEFLDAATKLGDDQVVKKLVKRLAKRENTRVLNIGELSGLQSGEVLYIVMHGSELKDWGAERFIDILKKGGVKKKKLTRIELVACEMGCEVTDIPQQLANALKTKVRVYPYKVTIDEDGLIFMKIREKGPNNLVDVRHEPYSSWVTDTSPKNIFQRIWDKFMGK